MLKDLPQSAQDEITHLLAINDFRGAKKIYDNLLETEEEARQVDLTKQTTYQSLMRILTRIYTKSRFHPTKRGS